MGVDVEELLAEIIRHHEAHGELPAASEIAAMAGGDPNLASRLVEAAHRYVSISASLDTGAIDIDSLPGGRPDPPGQSVPGDALPAFEGFRTIERIGIGGMGDIYKLQDLTLDRTVAAKVIRRQGGGLKATAAEFLREAKSLALFSDPRIVRLLEFRPATSPPVSPPRPTNPHPLLRGSIEWDAGSFSRCASASPQLPPRSPRAGGL